MASFVAAEQIRMSLRGRMTVFVSALARLLHSLTINFFCAIEYVIVKLFCDIFINFIKKLNLRLNFNIDTFTKKKITDKNFINYILDNLFVSILRNIDYAR